MISRQDINDDVAAVSRASKLCPSCGGLKPAGAGVCGLCWKSLTGMQRDWLMLFKRDGTEADALFRALAHLDDFMDGSIHLPEMAGVET